MPLEFFPCCSCFSCLCLLLHYASNSVFLLYLLLSTFNGFLRFLPPCLSPGICLRPFLPLLLHFIVFFSPSYLPPFTSFPFPLPPLTMAARVPAWRLQEGGSYEPVRCFSCLGFDLTLWDVMRIFPCILWSCMGIVCAGLFMLYPIVNDRGAHLLPMLGALQSAMPSFMCALLLLLYHRQRVRVFGLPREAAAAINGLYAIISTLGCFCYVTLLLTTVVVFQLDRTEDPAYFFLSSTWLLITLMWFILQSCLKPSAKQTEQLIRHYETGQPAPYPPAAMIAAQRAGGTNEMELTGPSSAQPIVVGQVRT